MRYRAGDLAVLNAESYEDGRRHDLSSDKTEITAAHVEHPESQGRSTRKRRKTVSPDAAGREEESRRSRGRPRLQPKDETAQDRRRTQIRLAQRAYRDRKENAIQALEKKVQELKDANEEMNSAFLRLRDYAVDCGLLECMPQVGRQLRETTETFLSLARKSSDDAFNDDDHSRPHESDSLPARRYAPRRKPSSRGQEQGTEDVSQRQLYGGFIITQEQVPVTSPDMPSGTTSVTEPTTAPDYGAITYPNLDNASFSFGTAPDFSFTAPELTTSTAQADFPDITNLNSPLYRSLPLPTSFAAQEVTFGRRVQRRCLERAWGLVNMPNPPPKRFSRVFGFCLLFEPLEAIKARVRRCLDRTASETLNNSQYPFLQLGGSTTHFEPIPGQRFGNQGAADAMRSKVANGYGMGPFDAKTSAARDLLGANQYLPHGSAGPEFYDCDEIEMYLHQRGVAIPSGADFVTAEIEVAAFADGPSRNQQAMSDNRSTASANAGSANSLDAFTPQTSSASGSASSDARSAMSAGPLSPAASSGGEAALAASSGTDFSLTDMWQMDRHWKGFVPGKRHVTVDINRLVAEMVNRATCLGRSPGLRKEDINGAFWSATSVTGEVVESL